MPVCTLVHVNNSSNPNSGLKILALVDSKLSCIISCVAIWAVWVTNHASAVHENAVSVSQRSFTSLWWIVLLSQCYPRPTDSVGFITDYSGIIIYDRPSAFGTAFGTASPEFTSVLHVGYLYCVIAFHNVNRRWLYLNKTSHLCWLRSTVGGTPVFGRRTDPVLRSVCSRRVTTMWVNRPLQVSQLGQLSLSSFRCQ